MVRTFLCVLALFSMILVGSASETQAQAMPWADPVPEKTNPVETYDYFLMPLATASGSAVGILVGSTFGLLACDEDCLSSVVGWGLMGGVGGAMLGSWVYTFNRDLDGSVIGWLAGYAGGVVSSLLIGFLNTQWENIEGASLAILPPLLGTVGYLAFAEGGSASSSTSSGLLHLKPDEGLRLGLPAVNVSVEEEDVRVSVPLLSGQF